jgi:nucleoside-diphosphate-sugar epimerase
MRLRLSFAALILCTSYSHSAAAAAAPEVLAAAAPEVLVLGSGGFLGRSLVSALRAGGYSVSEVTGRAHVDLRVPGALEAWLSGAAAPAPAPAPGARARGFSFVFFLACEVGGAKYLGAARAQSAILRHNVQMYEAVLPWAAAAAAARGTRTLFASSSMRFLAGAPAAGAYPAVKALGEEYVAAALPAGAGRSVRLFNLYGRERVSARSHVLSDWAAQCVRDGAVRSLTQGAERRQFLHVDDAAAALVAAMERWDDAFEPAAAGAAGAARAALDISSGEWTRLEDAARALSALAQSRLGLPPCPLVFAGGGGAQNASAPGNAAAAAAAAARPEIAPDAGAALHARWREWMPPARYPADAPIAAALRAGAPAAGSGAMAEGGLGWVAFEDGLADLLRYHVALLRAEDAAAADGARAHAEL